MTNLLEYFIEIGFKGDTKTLEKFNKTAEQGTRVITGFGLAFVGAVFGIERFVNTSVQSLTTLNNAAVKSGISLEKLQKWANSAQQIDLSLSSEQVINDITSLQSKIDNLRMGKGDMTPFALLGINPMDKNALQVLEEIRNVLPMVDRYRANSSLQDLGISNLQQSLLATRKEFNSLGSNRLLDKGQRDQILEGGRAIKHVKSELIALKDQAVAKLMPSVTLLMEKLFIWLEKNGDRVISILDKLGKGMLIFASSIARVGNWLITTKSGLLAIIGIIGLFVTRLNPLTILFTGLYLIIDDILAYLEGSPSVIGVFADSIKGFIENIAGFFKSLDLEKTLKILNVILAALGSIYAIWKLISKTKLMEGVMDKYDSMRDKKYYDSTQTNNKQDGSKSSKKGLGFGKNLLKLGTGAMGVGIAKDGFNIEDGEDSLAEWIKAAVGSVITGAAAGSVVPGVGTAVGAAGGLAFAGGAGLAALIKSLTEGRQVSMQTQINNNITQNINGNASPAQVGKATTDAIENVLESQGATMNMPSDLH
jgi:hypothetical protein